MPDGLIYQHMPRIAEAVGEIAKNRKHQGGYQYRSVDDVLNHCGPSLRTHGVTLCPQYFDHARRIEAFETKSGPKPVTTVTLGLKLLFVATDGSSIEVTTFGEGQDFSGDKATSKAMSNAFKYALFFALCIPVDASEIEDPDRDDPQQRQASPSTDTNYTEEEVAKWVQRTNDVQDPETLRRGIAKVEADPKFLPTDRADLLALMRSKLDQLLMPA